MTNREKFKEIFGFDLNTDELHCIAKGSCKDCPLVLCTEHIIYDYKYEECTDFWDDKYVEHDCTNCQHGDTDDTELPCRECGTGSDNKWSPIDEYNKIDRLADRITMMERCMDNYDSILKLHVRKIEHLEKQLLNRFYGTDNMKPFDTTPMCDIHKDGILGRVGD